MTEPVVERIRQAVVSTLAAITGEDPYFYRPEVAEVEGFWRAHFDDAADVFYQVRQGSTRSEEETSRTYTKETDFWIMLGHRYNPSSELPAVFPPGQDFASKVQNRMVADVERALLSGSGYTLQGLTENLEMSERNYEVYLDGWVLVECRLIARYSHHRDSP